MYFISFEMILFTKDLEIDGLKK